MEAAALVPQGAVHPPAHHGRARGDRRPDGAAVHAHRALRHDDGVAARGGTPWRGPGPGPAERSRGGGGEGGAEREICVALLSGLWEYFIGRQEKASLRRFAFHRRRILTPSYL